jgi:DNA polymerase kappa
MDLSLEQKQIQHTLSKIPRDMSQWIVHLDMDAFYASVEELDKPELKLIPMAVGGNAMLSTANYEARKYGVRSAMPGYIAKKLCPELVILPLSFPKYEKMSRIMQNVVAQYDPNYKAASLDEVYMNLTAYAQNHPNQSIQDLVYTLREEIFNATGLTCSAGIAANPLLAKICSNINKPSGQYFLPRDEVAILSFLSTLSIRKIPGIGRVMEQSLKALGIETCRDIRDQLVYLQRLFSPITFDFLLRTSHGIAENLETTESRRKGISAERTFSATADLEAFHELLVQLCQQLSQAMMEENIKGGRTLTLKLKASDFTIRTRSKTFEKPVLHSNDLFKDAKQMLEFEMTKLKQDLRLIGLRITNLLFEDDYNISTFFNQDSNQADQLEECPICEKIIASKFIMMHANQCLEESEKKIESENKKHPLKQESIGAYFNNTISRRSVPCPICQQNLAGMSNAKKNIHIDVCLATSAN